jgi:hypothetical protein
VMRATISLVGFATVCNSTVAPVMYQNHRKANATVHICEQPAICERRMTGFGRWINFTLALGRCVRGTPSRNRSSPRTFSA